MNKTTRTLILLLAATLAVTTLPTTEDSYATQARRIVTKPKAMPTALGTGDAMTGDTMTGADSMTGSDTIAGTDGDTAAPADDTHSMGDNVAHGYVEYDAPAVAKSLTEGKKVVLFFHASRCPGCVAVNKDLMTNMATLPSDAMVYKVNYDTASELKTKYGVTSQHTFVYLDTAMNATKKATGTFGIDDIVAGFTQ